jgi:hypothetical protein
MREGPVKILAGDAARRVFLASRSAHNVVTAAAREFGSLRHLPSFVVSGEEQFP